MRPFGSPARLQRRRERALKLLDEGYRPVDVAAQLGVDRRNVRRWRAAFGRRGRAGFQARPSRGRPPKLSTRQRRELGRVLLRGAQAAGFPPAPWTRPRVAQVIRSTFGIRFHAASS